MRRGGGGPAPSCACRRCRRRCGRRSETTSAGAGAGRRGSRSWQRPNPSPGRGRRILREPKHVPAGDAGQAAGPRDEQEAERPHAAEHVGVRPFARAGLGLASVSSWKFRATLRHGEPGQTSIDGTSRSLRTGRSGAGGSRVQQRGPALPPEDLHDQARHLRAHRSTRRYPPALSRSCARSSRASTEIVNISWSSPSTRSSR